MAEKDSSLRKPTAVSKSIRFLFSAKEYELLHQRILKRLPAASRSQLPSPSAYAKAIESRDDFNAATVRASLRVFLAVQAIFKVYDYVIAKLAARKGQIVSAVKIPYFQSPGFRFSLSAGLVLFFHRLLHRFLTRLRSNLSTKDAAPFRKRNPRVSRLLTSKYAPAVGAGLAGYAFSLSPANDLRLTIAIYIATRAGEFGWEALEGDGWFKNRPWWFGSWMLTPFCSGQLLHAFLFDRDCFPAGFGDFIINNTPNYIPRRPSGFPSDLTWPSTDTAIDGLANISRLHFPPYVSPILFPDQKRTLPTVLESVSPITSSAHPLIRNMTCALLHPSEPSCLKNNFVYYLKSIPRFARLFTIIFTIFALPRYKKFLQRPGTELNRLSKQILQTTLSISASIGTSWGMICFFQEMLPRHVLPTQRWFWGGFVAGLPAFLMRETGRSQFLYSLRTSLLSLWKVGTKKGYWKPGKTGDVWMVVFSLMLLNVVKDYNPAAITSGVFLKGVTLAQGQIEGSEDAPTGVSGKHETGDSTNPSKRMS